MARLELDVAPTDSNVDENLNPVENMNDGGEIPEKFDTPEALDKSFESLANKLGKDKVYKFMEQAQSKGGFDNLFAKPEEPKPEPTLDNPLDSLYSKYKEGTLKTEDLPKGTEPWVAKMYFENLANKEAQFEQSIIDYAGGDQAYKELQSWARANLDDEVQARYNKAFTSGDPDLAKMAIENIQAAKGQRLKTGPAAPQSQGPQKSEDEVMKILMTDPRCDENSPEFDSDYLNTVLSM